MVEEYLYIVLSEFGEVFPQVAPDGTKPPYLTYTLVSAIPKQTPSGVVQKTKSRWQIDIYERSSYKSKKLREMIVDKMLFLSVFSELTWRDGYEQRVKFYRQIVEFYIKQTGECNGN